MTAEPMIEASHDVEKGCDASFDGAADLAIVAADPDGRITDWNEGAEHLLGWSAAEARGRPLSWLSPPEARDAPAPELRWQSRRDGGRFWAQCRLMTVRRDDGDVRGYLLILQDRGRERRRAQRLDLLARVSVSLLTSDDPLAALMSVLEDGAEALGFDRSYAWDITAGGRRLSLDRAVGMTASEQAAFASVDVDVPLCGLVAASGMPLVLTALQSTVEPRYAIAREAGLTAYAGYPLFSRGRITGVISFATLGAPAFDRESLTFFAILAQFLSAARGRLDAEQAIRASEERRRLAAEAGLVGLWSRDLVTETFDADERTRAMHGIADGMPMTRASVSAAIHPDDRDRVDALTEELVRGEVDTLSLPYRTLSADGRLRHVQVNKRLMRGPDGRPVGTVGAIRDVTEEAEAEARQVVLNDEIAHRLKNTLAMVQSIAVQSLRGVAEREPVRAFERRILALGSAHEVLLRRTWTGADLQALTVQVLHATGQAERIEVSGPAVAIGPQAALSVALVLHELATNAVKYGALSAEFGRVVLSWRIDAAGLVLDWVERGGPPAVEPGRVGFGSRLIRLGLVGTGGVTLRYGEDGFEAEMRASLAHLRRS